MNVDPTTLIGRRRRSGASSSSRPSRSCSGLLVGAVLIILSGAHRAGHDLRPDPADHGLRRRCSRAPSAARRPIANTLNAATPLIFAGLAVAFGFRAGLFNIGANGQFLVGAFCAAIVGHDRRASPFPIALLAGASLAGALGGAAWGFIPGALKAWRGAHEVVTTIMLNSIAYLLLNLLASSVFKDPTATFPRTPGHPARRRPADHPRRHPPARRHHRRRCSPRSPSGSSCSRRRSASRSGPSARTPARPATPASGRRSSPS